MMARRYQYGTLEEIETAQGRTWYIRFTNPPGVKPARPRFRVGLKSQFPTEAKASRAAQTIRDKFNESPAELTVSRYTFRDLVTRYEAEEMPERYSTRRGYIKIHKLYILPKWGDVLIQDVTPEAARDWLKSLDKSPRTVGHVLAQMRVLFRYAMFWRWIPAAVNPMSLFSIPGTTKRTRKPRVVPVATWRKILESETDPQHRVMLMLGYLLGLRVSEMFALKWGDIDHHEGRIHIRRAVVDGRVGNVKTERSEAPLPMAKVVSDALLALRKKATWKAADDWVFASEVHSGKKPMNSKWIQQNYLKDAGKKVDLGFQLGWHTLRHSYKVLLERAGADVTVQRDLMRHADAHTTMQVYGEVEFDRMREANEKAVKLAMQSDLSN